MTATMMDIAKDLKVSVVTVSKVLRNQGRISDATRKRVLRRAKQLNYQMNWVARSLVTRRTYTIGLLLPEFAHPFFAEIARAVAQTVRPHGYHVVISCFEEDPELEVSEADSLLARRVDGLIIASSQPPRHLGLFKRIQEQKVPFVLIDRPIAGLRACFVGVDNYAIGELATEHLIARGCQPDCSPARSRSGNRRRTPGRATAGRWRSTASSAFAVHRCRAAIEMTRGYEGMRQLLTSARSRMEFSVTTTRSRSAPCGPFWRLDFNCHTIFAVVGAGNVHYSDACGSTDHSRSGHMPHRSARRGTSH